PRPVLASPSPSGAGRGPWGRPHGALVGPRGGEGRGLLLVGALVYAAIPPDRAAPFGDLPATLAADPEPRVRELAATLAAAGGAATAAQTAQPFAADVEHAIGELRALATADAARLGALPSARVHELIALTTPAREPDAAAGPGATLLHGLAQQQPGRSIPGYEAERVLQRFAAVAPDCLTSLRDLSAVEERALCKVVL